MIKKGLLTLATALWLVICAPASADFGSKPPPATALNFHKHQQALDEAAKANKHVMVYFRADWCRYCKMFDEEVLPNAKVVKALGESFLSVAVNVEDDPDLAKRYGAKTLPMIVFLDSGGQKVGYLPGYIPAPEFLEVLSFVKNKNYLQN